MFSLFSVWNFSVLANCIVSIAIHDEFLTFVSQMKSRLPAAAGAGGRKAQSRAVSVEQLKQFFVFGQPDLDLVALRELSTFCTKKTLTKNTCALGGC